MGWGQGRAGCGRPWRASAWPVGWGQGRAGQGLRAEVGGKPWWTGGVPYRISLWPPSGGGYGGREEGGGMAGRTAGTSLGKRLGGREERWKGRAGVGAARRPIPTTAAEAVSVGGGGRWKGRAGAGAASRRRRPALHPAAEREGTSRRGGGQATAGGGRHGARGVRTDGYGRLQQGGRIGVGIAPIPPA